MFSFGHGALMFSTVHELHRRSHHLNVSPTCCCCHSQLLLSVGFVVFAGQGRYALPHPLILCICLLCCTLPFPPVFILPLSPAIILSLSRGDVRACAAYSGHVQLTEGMCGLQVS